MVTVNQWALSVIILSLIFAGLGCGKVLDEGVNTAIKNPLPVKAANPAVKEFDKQLGEIKDQASAEKAVNTFIDYVDTRIDKPTSGPSAQSLRALVAPNLVQEIARVELLARNGQPIKAYSEDGEEETVKPLIDVGTIRDTLVNLAQTNNESGPTANTADDNGQDKGVWIDDEIVKTAKAMAEESLPNLNSEKKQEMTPLGAIVVGYALASGDNGSAPEDSVKLSTEKIGAYVETISQ